MKHLTDDDEIELMRLLHGELPEAREHALRERLRREPELAAAYARLEGAWQALELPPSPAAPPGFAARLAARARQPAAAPLSWALAPAWVRATAAAALVAGLALGVGAGHLAGRPVFDEAAAIGGVGGVGGVGGAPEPSLAEGYWELLGDLEGSSAAVDGVHP